MSELTAFYISLLILIAYYMLNILSIYFLFIEWCSSVSNCLFLIYVISVIISLVLLTLLFKYKKEFYKKYALYTLTILKAIYVIMFVIMLIPESRTNCKNDRILGLIIVFFSLEITDFIFKFYESLKKITELQIQENSL